MPLADAISSRNRMNALAAEAAMRKREGLAIYRPRPEVLAFHRSKAPERLLKGGNRCSAEGTVVWLLPCPTNNCGAKPWSTMNPMPVPIESVNVGDRLVGFTTGGRKNQSPSMVLEKKEFRERGYRLATTRGYSTVCTHDHPVLCAPPMVAEWHNAAYADPAKAEWRDVTDIPAGWYVRIGFGPYRDKEIESDDDAYFQGQMDGDGSDGCNYGVMKHTTHVNEASTREWLTGYLRKNGVDGAVKEYPKQDSNGVSLEWCNKAFKTAHLESELQPTPSVMKGYIQGLMDADGCFTTEGKVVLIQKDLVRLRRVQQWLLLFGIKASLYITPPRPQDKRPNATGRLQISGASVTHYCRTIGFRHPEKSRKAEVFGKKTQVQGRAFWDRVVSVMPTKEVRFVGIRTQTGTYLADGIYSHNSGKTVAGTAEIASAATRRPITTWEGEKIWNWPTDRPLLLWLIGFDQRHLARMYKKLFTRRLQLKIIQDEITGEWRTWRPWEEADAAREKQVKNHPGLIDQRYVESVSWEDKGKGVPSNIVMKNGTELVFMPSGGEVGVGDAVDGIWIDEAIQISEHLPEWQARLSDNEGRLIWTSWPKTGGGGEEALRLMEKRAAEQEGESDPDIEAWTLTYSGNPYIPAQSKERRLRAWAAAGPETLMARDLGLFADGLQLVFPSFDIDKHGIPTQGDPGRVERSVREATNMLPAGWTYYLVLDPGFAHIAAVFAMVPPPTLGDAVVIRRSWYWAKVDARMVAADIKEEFPDVPWYAFIIDAHAGRVHTTGRGERVVDVFSEAFEREEIESEITGNGFIMGSDDIPARNMLVRKWLNDMENGAPKFMLCTEHTHPMQREFRLYKCRVGQYDNDDVVKRDNHSMDCNGYLMSYLNPLFAVGEAWARPVREPYRDPVLRAYEEMTKKQKGTGGSSSFWMGAGAVPTIGATL